MTKDKTFHIPFESLGIKKLGESYTRDDSFSNDTLVHEITHQMMHDYLPYVPKWVSEGSAEYTEMLPYKAGRFRVADHAKGLKDYVDGPAIRRGEKPAPDDYGPVTLPDLDELFRMTHQLWDKGPDSGSGISAFGVGFDYKRQHRLYRQSALMVYYFNHLDGEPPSQGQRWMRFMDAVKAESLKWVEFRKSLDRFLEEQKAFFSLPGVTRLADGRYSYPSNLTPPKPPESPDGGLEPLSEKTPLKHLDLLLDGRTLDQVEEDMAAKFAKMGLKFTR